MLISMSRFENMPVMSLQTGRELARISEPIINPHTLQIIAFFLEGRRLDFSPAVIFASDIREIGRLGAIVDSSDKIINPDDVVRLKQILDYNFSLMNLKVISDDKKRLGRVSEFLLDPSDFMIKQILVKPNLSQRISIAQRTITRQQIQEIDNKKIVVKLTHI